MRKWWIASALLCPLLALAGCRTWTVSTNAPPAYPSTTDAPTARAAAPELVSRPPTPDAHPPVSSTGPVRPQDSPSPSAPPVPQQVVYTMPVVAPQGCGAPVQSVALALPAPGPDEIAQALKENADALATLRTAQRALEASHAKLETLLKRQGAPTYIGPPASPYAPAAPQSGSVPIAPSSPTQPLVPFGVSY